MAAQATVHRFVNTTLDLLRNDGRLYVTIGAETFEGEITRASLVE
jgi:hypothetical protein